MEKRSFSVLISGSANTQIMSKSLKLQCTIDNWSPEKEKLHLLSDLSKEERDLVYDRWFAQFRYQAVKTVNVGNKSKTVDDESVRHVL
jgi:hypothetical protein